MCLPKKLSGEAVQAIAATVGSLQYLSFGLMLAITPFHIRLYQSSTETPLNHSVDAQEASWLSGYLFLGVAVGSLIFGVLTNKLGPKTVLVLGGLLQLISWFTIHFATDIQHVLASRAFNGAGSGAAFMVLPIFITEITKDFNIAAKLIALAELWRIVGIFFGFLFARFLPYMIVPIIGIGISLAFILTFPFVQESPYYYMEEGNHPLMEKSLRWYRGIRHRDDHAKPSFVREIAVFTHEMQESQPIVVTSLPWAYRLKLGLYCFVLTACAQLSGVYFILNYVLDLYDESNTPLIFSGTQILGAIIAVWLGVKANRKILLTLSGLISGFSLILLVFAGKWNIGTTQSALTVSMTFLTLHLFSASIGLHPVAVIVTQELLTKKLRSTYTTIVCTISWTFLFVVIQSYQYVSAYNLTDYFGFFSGVCFLVTIVAFTLLPDTKTKSKEEVQRDLGFAVAENIARLSTITNGRINESTYI